METCRCRSKEAGRIRAEAIAAAKQRRAVDAEAVAIEKRRLAGSGSIAAAKRHLTDAPESPPLWHAARGMAASLQIDIGAGEVTLNDKRRSRSARYVDNTERVAVDAFDRLGNNLPHSPCVLVGCGTGSRALALPWTAASLAARFDDDARFEVDGGPCQARWSLGSASVSMHEYARYAREDGDGDDAPLYVFDPLLLTRRLAAGGALSDEYAVPRCFRADAMACIHAHRPLPPAWLLVGATRSGTPWHNHPLTAAWNLLLSGRKLWVAMPPATELAPALSPTSDPPLGEDEGEDTEDLAAAEWFLAWRGNYGGDDKAPRRPPNGLPPPPPRLPDSACVIVQRPGETVFLPAGWWHVVLNVEPSCAVSHSLALHRDVARLWPLLEAEDPRLAGIWRKALDTQGVTCASELLRELALDIT